MIIWNFFILGFIFIAIFFKPNWLIMAIVGFMVRIKYLVRPNMDNQLPLP
jgi:hypothetical protein